MPGRRQLYSTKLIVEAWSLRLWSTALCLAYGETTSIGSRGPKPQRPCSPPSGAAVCGLGPHWPDVAPVSVVLVRLSAGDSDWLVTPLFAWSYQPSESS